MSRSRCGQVRVLAHSVNRSEEQQHAGKQTGRAGIWPHATTLSQPKRDESWCIARPRPMNGGSLNGGRGTYRRGIADQLRTRPHEVPKLAGASIHLHNARSALRQRRLSSAESTVACRSSCFSHSALYCSLSASNCSRAESRRTIEAPWARVRSSFAAARERPRTRSSLRTLAGGDAPSGHPSSCLRSSATRASHAEVLSLALSSAFVIPETVLGIYGVRECHLCVWGSPEGGTPTTRPRGLCLPEGPHPNRGETKVSVRSPEASWGPSGWAGLGGV